MRFRIQTLALLALAWSAPLFAQTTDWAKPTYTQQVDPASMDEPEVVANPGPIERMLVGEWDLWVPGGIWYSSDGLHVYQNYTPGAAMNRLVIRTDGTYRWGDREGKLVEIRPWFAQPRDRYYAVAMNESMRYMARWNAETDELLLFFWGVGGNAAKGTRIGEKPTPRPGEDAAVGGGAQPDRGVLVFTGAAVNSGVRGDARLVFEQLDGNKVRVQASFSGGLAGSGVLEGTLRGGRLSVTGELDADGTRYTMVVTGEVTDGALEATYTLTPKSLWGWTRKQGGTIQAWLPGRAPAGGAASGAGVGATNPLGVEWVGGNAGSNQPADPSNPLGVEWVGENAGPRKPADPSNPLGVEWVGGDTGKEPPPSSSDPNCAPNPLGVVWAQCKTESPSLHGTWRYVSLQVRRENGAVQAAPVEGTLTLRQDGTFTQSLEVAGTPVERTGRYTVDGATIRLTGAAGQSVTLRFAFDDGRLRVTEEQRGTRYEFDLVRQ